MRDVGTSGELAKRYYEAAWGRGELDVVDEICADAVRDHWHRIDGVAAVKEVIAGLRRTFPDLEVDVRRQVVAGDEVATYVGFCGTDHGGLFRMRPTGRRVEFAGMFLDRFQADRLVEHWAVTDMMSVFRQLEVIPPRWQADRPLE